MAFDNPFKNLPKPVIIGGIVTVTAVTGFLLYRHHAATGSWFGGGSSSATTTASAIDPVTGLPTSQDNVVDPATNETYLAEAEQYGSVAAAEAAVSSYGTTVNSGTGSSTEFGQNGATTTAAGAVAASTYTSNAAWDQAAIAGLEDISGGSSYNGTDIATALGDILQGQPVTASQIQVWNAAVGEFGPPPSPVSPILAPVTSPSGTTTGSAPSTPGTPTGTTEVTVPNVIGRADLDTAEGILASAGLNPASRGDPGAGNKGSVTSQSPAAGTLVPHGTTVIITYTVKTAKKA
jgi:hypothetical protein